MLDTIIRLWTWADAPDAYRPAVDLLTPPDWVAVYSPTAGFGALDALLSLPGCAFAKQYPGCDGTVIVVGWKAASDLRKRFTSGLDFQPSAAELA